MSRTYDYGLHLRDEASFQSIRFKVLGTSEFQVIVGNYRLASKTVGYYQHSRRDKVSRYRLTGNRSKVADDSL